MRRILWSLFVLLALVAGGCGYSSKVNETTDGTLPDGTPATTVSAVTLSFGDGTTATTLASDGSITTTLRAVVTDSASAPVSGAAVTFKSVYGSFSPATTTTNSSGVAMTIYTPPTTIGAGTMTASTSGGLFSNQVTASFIPGAPAQSTLSASPAILGLGGQTNLQAEVTDAAGNPVEAATVRFEFATSGNESGGQFVTINQATDVNGRAKVLYAAGSTVGVDKVRAVTLGVTSNIVDLSVTADSTDSRAKTLTLVAKSSTLVAGINNKTSLIATVLDEAGIAMKGQTVTFSTSQGTLSAASAVTLDSGEATVSLFATASPAVAYVTAESSGFVRDTIVSFVAGAASTTNSSIIADPATIPADGKSTSTITVTLLDANKIPVADGTSVSLTSNAGTLTSTTATTTSGRATFTLTAATSQQTATLSTTLLSGLTGTIVMGSRTSGEPANIILSVSNSHLFVAGVGKTENTNISVNLLDAAGMPINDSDFTYNNLKVSWVSRPRGGEYLTGIDKDGKTIARIDDATATMSVKTFGGAISLNLQSGILPGSIEIEVEALKADGSSFVPPVKARLPQIVISSGPPHAITLTSPITDAVVNMGGGVYKRKGTAIVTDRYGNSVPDGTVISLGLVDSVIAQGSDGVTSSSGGILTSAQPQTTDQVLTTFSMASITRNGLARTIQQNDRVLIANAFADDKSHFVKTINSGTIDTTKAYKKDGSALEYVVGASLLGGNVDGCSVWSPDAITNIHDSCTTYAPGEGKSKQGFVPFWVIYPSDSNHVMIGAIPTMDTRYKPLNSARVFLVASSSDDSATAVNEGGFYFAPIAGYTLTAAPAKFTSSGVVSLDLEDGGDKVPVPFSFVGGSVTIDKLGTYGICTNPTLTTQADCEASGGVWTNMVSDLRVRTYINTVKVRTSPILCSIFDMDGDGFNDVLNSCAGDVEGFDINGNPTGIPDGIPDDLNNDGDVDVDQSRMFAIDHDGNGTIDFYSYPYTFVGGYAYANVLVTGSRTIKDDAATVTFKTGDSSGFADVKVLIP